MGLPRLRASAITLLVDALHALVYIPIVALCKIMPLYLCAHDPPRAGSQRARTRMVERKDITTLIKIWSQP